MFYILFIVFIVDLWIVKLKKIKIKIMERKWEGRERGREGGREREGECERQTVRKKLLLDLKKT